MSLQHLTLREWRLRRGRTMLTLFSVAMGVSAILGTSLAQQSVRASLRKVQEATEGPPALVIVATKGGRFQYDSLPAVAQLRGVRTVSPLLSRGISARIGGVRFRTFLLGMDTSAAPADFGLRMTAGRMPQSADEALLSSDLAQELTADLESRLTILTSRGPRSATVVGLVSQDSLELVAPGSQVVMPLATAQSWNRLEGQIDRVQVIVDSRESRAGVAQELEKMLPAGFTVQTPVHPLQLADDLLRSTELAMSFAGALAAAMAAFIILNTLRTNFAERRRQLAILRALGATGGQLTRLLLREGALLGILGALLGAPGGLLLAWALGRAMEHLVNSVAPVLTLQWESIAFAMAFGVCLSTMAALLPALQARRISPVEGMRDPEIQRDERFSRAPAIFALSAWVLAVGILIGVATETIPPVVAIGAGMLMLVSFIALLRVIVGPVLRILSKLLPRRWELHTQLASQQLIRRATRTGLTAGVLVVVMSNAIGLGNAIQANVDDLRAWHRKAMSGDFFLAPSKVDTGNLQNDEQLAVRLRDLPGVAELVSLRFRTARVAGRPSMCIVRDFPVNVELPWGENADEVARLRAALARGEAVISSIVARRFELQPGDTFPVDMDGRAQLIKVGGVVSDYNLGGNAIYLDHVAAANIWELPRSDLFMIFERDDADRGKVEAALASFAQANSLLVLKFDELRRQLDAIVNGVVGALYSLTAVGFVIGGVAVANTLTISVLDRTGELGLLRIVGMKKSQVALLVVIEAGLLGLLGTFMGVLAGVSTAWIIHVCNEPLLGRSVPFELSLWLTLAAIGGCLATSVVAAIHPALRAARMNVLAAIAYE